MRGSHLEEWPAEGRPARPHMRRVWLAGAGLLALWMMCGQGDRGGTVMAAVGGMGAGGSSERFGPCRVTRVVDGDTVDAECGNESGRVRLLNVNTPERGEPGYWEAGEALEDLLDGDVYLEFGDAERPSYDRYGRLLAYLFDEDGRNLNRQMIRDGWSPYYREYGDGRFPDDFEDAEEDARDEELGLWEDY